MDSLKIYDILIESLLVFLLVFTPLAYGAVGPWGIAVFELTASLMAIIFLFKIFNKGVFEFTPIPVTLFIFLFIGYVLLQYLVSCNWYLVSNIQVPGSIYPWATKTELLKLISYAMIFLVTLNTIKTKRQITRILSVIITMGFLMSIFYLMRYFGAPAPRGFINSDHFSAYLGMIIPLVLGLLLVGNASVNATEGVRNASVIASHATEGGVTKQSHTEFGIRPLLFFTIVIMSAALFFTMSRGGMFSFIAALLFIALLVSTRRSMKKKGWIILAIAVFIILIIAWLGATPVVERILSVKAEITSRYFGGRLPIWQGTLNIIRDYPIFGTGLGTFNYIFPKYQPLAIINKHYTYAHSDILELLSEVGIVGFALSVVCGLWTVVYIFRRFRQRHDPWVVGMSLCGFGSLTAIFIYSFADFNLHIPANAILITIILALLLIVLNYDYSLPLRAYNLGSAEPLFYTVILTLMATFVILSIWPPSADYYFRRYKGAILEKDSSLALLQTAIRLDPENALYHYEFANLYFKDQKIEKALEEYREAIRLNPSNSKYRQSLAWAYGQLADLYASNLQDKQHNIVLAYLEFQKAIELEPNSPYRHRAYAIWLFSHATKENIEKGVQVYRKAIALDPKLADKALADYFKVEKRYARLKKVLPDTPENHSKVMAMLLDAGLWEANEDDFKKDMEAASHKYPYYKAISLYYEKRGDRIKSIEILADYLKIDPNCADAHFYIADGMVYIKPVNWQEVFLHYERALTLSPENNFYREWYARRLFYTKRHNDAIVELEKVVATDWWNIELHRLLGDWYKSAGRIKDADAMYAKASRVSEHLKSEKNLILFK